MEVAIIDWNAGEEAGSEWSWLQMYVELPYLFVSFWLFYQHFQWIHDKHFSFWEKARHHIPCSILFIDFQSRRSPSSYTFSPIQCLCRLLHESDTFFERWGLAGRSKATRGTHSCVQRSMKIFFLVQVQLTWIAGHCRRLPQHIFPEIYTRGMAAANFSFIWCIRRAVRGRTSAQLCTIEILICVSNIFCADSDILEEEWARDCIHCKAAGDTYSLRCMLNYHFLNLSCLWYFQDGIGIGKLYPGSCTPRSPERGVCVITAPPRLCALPVPFVPLVALECEGKWSLQGSKGIWMDWNKLDGGRPKNRWLRACTRPTCGHGGVSLYLVSWIKTGLKSTRNTADIRQNLFNHLPDQSESRSRVISAS